MLTRTYRGEGIVLAKKNYGEADKIIVIYCKEFGKISFIAKGVRKPTSRKRASIEVFNHIRFSAAKGKGLDMITEAEALYSFDAIRKRLPKVAVAYYFMEVVGRLTQDGEKNEEFFTHLLDSLHKLSSESSLTIQREVFVKETLAILGFWPRQRVLEGIDAFLETIVERKINSIGVGKKILR